MEIVVHGTKQGYKSNFIPNFQASFALGDIRNGVNNESPLGKSIYSLSFIRSGCVYSKYTIVRDTLRSYAIGNIAFSLFLPANKELSGKGKDIKSLLDKISSYYIEKYVRENNINKGEITLIQEDWSFLSDISSEFTEQKKIKGDVDIQSGTKDPAFHYYKFESELIEHLDEPFQDEYNGYRQIFFIDNNLQGVSNPLNVIKNSGVEVNPDLKNPPYKLKEFYGKGVNGINIQIINSSGRELHNSDKLYRKDELTLIYSKKYYIEKRIVGSLLNNEELGQYLIESGDNKIEVVNEIKLEPETKTLIFNVTNKDGERVSDAEIQVDNKPWQYCSNDTFSAEEIGREHIIIAQKGNLRSDTVKIIPKDHLAAQISLNLKLINKVVKITAKDKETGDDISQFRVHIKGIKFNKITERYIDKDEIVFGTDSIDKEWSIHIEKRNKYFDSENILFCPAKDRNEINFILQKKSNGKYEPSSQEHVEMPWQEQELKRKTFASKFRGFFSKPVVIASSVMVILILGTGIWAMYNHTSNDEQPTGNLIISKQISNYVNGIEINLDTLKIYKIKWGNKEQDFIMKSNAGIFGGKVKVDSSKWKSEWKPTDERIDLAIKKRNLVNSMNFAELKSQQYSTSQKQFGDAINKIEKDKYKEIGQKLGNVSTLTLVQIAEKINEILKAKEPEKNLSFEESREYEKEKSEFTGKNDQPKAPANQQEQKTGSTSKTSEIIQYIRGSELDEAKLKEYRDTKGIGSNLKSSIQLCLDFWALDGSTNGKNSKTYWSLREKVKVDENLKNSKLIAFLNEMCQEGSNSSYSKQDKKKGLK